MNDYFIKYFWKKVRYVIKLLLYFVIFSFDVLQNTI